ALVAAATLSHRYISDRFLPDKAIDLIDESASRLRMEIDSRPVEIDEKQRAVDRLKMEEMALSKESDPASAQRLERLPRDLADRQEELSALTAQWDKERSGLNRVGELKQKLDDLRSQAERAQREGDLGKASELLYGQIPALERELADASATAEESEPMVKEEVGVDDIAAVISSWTGIPAGRMMEGETAKLLRMDESLQSRVIGQAEAVRAVADAVRRARAGIADPDRPTGSFLFLGPTGVGKTELAKALAEFLFDDERAMVRIDMSEYGEKHSVARVVGTQPLQAGVPQPAGRHRGVPLVDQRRPEGDRGHPAQPAGQAAGRPAADPGGHRTGEGVAGQPRVRPDLRRPAVAPAGTGGDRRP